MATIGNLAVKLTVVTAQFAQGMGRAARSVVDFGGRVSGLSSVSGKLQAVLAGLSAGALIAWVTSAANATIATNRLARSLGATTQGVQQLEFAVSMLHGDTAAVGEGLSKLNESLSEAAYGSTSLRDAFARLGLDAKKLAALPADQAFARVAEAIGREEDASRRAALAVQIFGDSAKSLLPVMVAGQAGLQGTDKAADRLGSTAAGAQAGLAGLGKQAEQLGVSMTDAQAEAIESAFSMELLGHALDGVAKQIAANIAPMVIALTEQLNSAGGAGVNVAAAVKSGFRAVAQGVAIAIDAVDYLKAAWKFLQVAIDLGMHAIALAVGQLGRAIALLPGQLGQAGEAIKQFADNLAADTLADAERLRKEFQGIVNTPSSLAKVDGFFGGLEKGAAAATAKTKALRGAMGSVAQVAKNSSRYKESLGIIDSSKTPLQKFQEQMAKLNGLVRDGAIGFDTYARSAAEAVAELERAHQLAEIRLPSAVQANTAEARNAEIQSDRIEQLRFRETPQQRVERIQSQSLEIERQQLTMQRRIGDVLQRAAREADNLTP